MLYIVSDHRGFALNKKINEFLTTAKIPFKDIDNNTHDPDDDIPVFAAKVASRISKNPNKDLGITICGTGAGACIACNKFKNVRASVCITVDMAKQAKEHLNTNVLCLASDITEPSIAWMIVKKWLSTKVSQKSRYQTRLKQIKAIEKNNFKSV